MKREPPPPLNPTASLQPISLEVLREKYLKPGETTADELYQRVARLVSEHGQRADDLADVRVDAGTSATLTALAAALP